MKGTVDNFGRIRLLICSLNCWLRCQAIKGLRRANYLVMLSSEELLKLYSCYTQVSERILSYGAF